MQQLRSPSSLCRPRNPQIWSLSSQICTPDTEIESLEMKSINGSVQIAFNQAPAPPVTRAVEALAALLVSALAKSLALDQFGLLMGDSPINKGGRNAHVDQPEPFDVDGSGERNGSSGDSPLEKLPDGPKKEDGEAGANGTGGEDSEDQEADADQGDAPDEDRDDDDDDGEDDAEDGGDDDDDNDDDDEEDENDGPNAAAEGEEEEEDDDDEDEEGGGGGEEEESGGGSEEDEEEEELQPPKKRNK